MEKKQVKIIDCTLRDGGLMNNWNFSDDLVKRMYEADLKSSVSIMEIGYKASPKIMSVNDYGKWRFCFEEDIRRVIPEKDESMQISVMADIGRCTKDDFIHKSFSYIDIIRIACYIHQVDDAIDLANYLHEMQYETFINIMGVSQSKDEEISNVLKQIEATAMIKGIYLSDTFGAFRPIDIRHLTSLYRIICQTKAIGFHGHNNTQLALANSLTAMENGALYLDGTYFGMGRGAGNCPLELLLPAVFGKNCDISPIIEIIEHDFEKMIDQYKWGYKIPYAITGICNQHPRNGLKMLQEEKKKAYSAFYQECLTSA